MKLSKSRNIIKKTKRSSSKSNRHRLNKNNDKIVKGRQRVTKKTEPVEKKQQITIKRSSGRKEKFDTDRMAQTVGRSGVPFLMARDVAKKVSRKIKKEALDQHNKRIDKRSDSTKQLKGKTVTADRIRNLVDVELRDRNRSDIAASYSGQTPENTSREQNLKDKQPVVDTVAANRNRVLHDTSKRGGGIMT
jgi:hypothetical protein